MKSIKVQNHRRKCSAVVETASGAGSICIYAHRAPLIDGLGRPATQRVPRPRLVATSHRLASCVIVSGFRTALDLDTYPFRNLIRPQCAERAKPGRGKPVLIHYAYWLFRLFAWPLPCGGEMPRSGFACNQSVLLLWTG